jgi:predicted DNA-binding antitoxin AbrB/MazE fold protein
MMIKARYEKGVFVPQTKLDLEEGDEVEIIVKPQIASWVGALKGLKPKSSVDLQHDIKDMWTKDYVSH